MTSFRTSLVLCLVLLAFSQAFTQYFLFIPKLLIENTSCTDVKTVTISPSKYPIAIDKNSCYPIDAHATDNVTRHVVVIIQNAPQTLPSLDNGNYEVELTLHMNDRTYKGTTTLNSGDELATVNVAFNDTSSGSKSYKLGKVTGKIVTNTVQHGHAATAIAITESILIAGVLLAFIIVKIAIPAYRRRRGDSQYDHEQFGNQYDNTPSSILQRNNSYDDN
ncbi:hypothetical protein L596_005644 [Steinernema carpocapsae]|uniref:Uncharacterized protein n=1 Tax=Steinernema carpocapsae TaxID=34508 RepID=A0A4U8V147_STECR|nr:hypothetical protein L596_005644 [Steinernema carpocapsae]